MRFLLACLAVLVLGGPLGAAEAPVSFKDKTITMIIGYAPGGGTDASGRTIAPFIGKHLPGNPTVVVQNVPGADGMTALNYFVQQVKPDGLTITMGASTQVDLRHAKSPNSRYDPSKFNFVGGVGRGGTVLILRKDAEPRLLDKSKPPVMMGVNGGLPRSGMLITAWGIEYLGWNAKWVLGYGETNALMIALERGEIDMTSTANMFQIGRLTQNGTAMILTQSGALEKGKLVGRPDFGKTPIFPEEMAGKIKDPLQQKAFDYWRAISSIDKWLALPPGTPAPIVAAYREAYREMGDDPEFLALGRKISEDFAPQSHEDVEQLVAAVVSVPPEAMDFTDMLLKKQGINLK